jgi:UDP-2-acetamido-2,6-beta-L-arabino-hexul-4-ose reductase
MTSPRIVVTGANGFVGKNLLLRLAEAGHQQVVGITRSTGQAELERALSEAAIIFHLAGANRPPTADEFHAINVGLTETIAQTIERAGTAPLIVFASSTKAVDNNDYGRSKHAAEDILLALADRTPATVLVQRLPNIFGKWARPNYNSAVATFCHNVSRQLPITVSDPASPLTLLYIDDLIDQWLGWITDAPAATGFMEPAAAYATTVGEVADTIRGFAADRDAALIDSVGVGLTRALYATYVANLPTDSFAYPLTAHVDPRGSFSEMLRTRTSGQFSYFTAHPGVTRGGHYHHTKTEKFLVVHGQARFRFRHVLTNETHELSTSSEKPVVVETIPGWAHDITNIGHNEMVVLLWANEIFLPERPDTIWAQVSS